MKRNWTPEQLAAIEARGGSVLVSAAAGSGKTAVLVERVIRRIADPADPVSADTLVVATFSNAAAAEIRERVEAALEERLLASPNDYGLRRQQMLLQKAHIGTIHSFCLNLIRRNFQKLDIPADFRIGDENELALMRGEACSEVIEEAYQTGDDTFLALVELVSSSRDDRALAQTVERLYAFVRSHPFFDGWFEDKLDQYDPERGLTDTEWGKCILDYACEALSHAKDALQWATDTIMGDEKLTKAYLPAFSADRTHAASLLSLAQSGDWDGLYAALRKSGFARLGSLRGFEDTALKDRLTAVRGEYKDIVKNLRERQLCATTEQHRDDMRDLHPKVARLFALVQSFALRYEEKKREKSYLDFSDLEQLALRLLVRREDGKTLPTPLARELSAEISEICIDEYQDVNEAQNEIFSAVSKEGGNLFLVGDVKQSIYRFRQAMPELFMRCKDEFAPYDGVSFPAKLILGRNFRSRAGVTDAVNFTFHQLMSRRVGEIDYSGEEYLIPAAQYPPADAPFTRLHILDVNEVEEDAGVLEARHIAAEIQALVRGGVPVTDGGVQRPIRYGDIAILLRSVKGRAPVFEKELAACGVPVRGDAGGDALTAREVSVLLALLRAVDNPLSDLDVAAVMLSPMFLFTATQLSYIRLAAPRAPLWLAAAEYAHTDEKTADFLQTLSILRTEAVSLPVDRLIDRAYRLTDYDLKVRAMTGGEKRLANLRLLCEYARGYESAGYGGLPGFVRLMTRMTEEGLTLGEAPAFFNTGDTVRIMSIHKSKGLEFPVCFVADCAKQFNRRDLAQQSLLHSRLGFSCKRRLPEEMLQFTTVPHEALRLELARGMTSEELRVLYVAMTRAKERLYITAAEKNIESKLARLAVGLTGGESIDPFTVMGGMSFSDWLISAALRRPEAELLRERAGLDGSVVLDNDKEEPWEILIKSAPVEETRQDASLQKNRQGEAPRCEPDADLLARLRQRVGAQYPHQAAAGIPTKLAVSDIAKKQGGTILGAPAFTFSQGLTPAQKGSALHKFMQFADYDAARKNLTEELARMEQLAYLSGEEAAAVDKTALKRFFDGTLAARMFSSERVMRELKFIFALSAAEYAQDDTLPPGESVMLQGVADCVFFENGGLVVVDYKTDRVKTAGELASRYATQLYYYKRAMMQSFALPVKQCLLYSFALGEAIEIAV